MICVVLLCCVCDNIIMNKILLPMHIVTTIKGAIRLRAVHASWCARSIAPSLAINSPGPQQRASLLVYSLSTSSWK